MTKFDAILTTNEFRHWLEIEAMNFCLDTDYRQSMTLKEWIQLRLLWEKYNEK